MQSSLIGKIEKAKRYSEEKDRASFSELRVNFRGDHNSHVVKYKSGEWDCTCSFFPRYGLCSHTMAMQRILGEMVSASGIPAVGAGVSS